MTERLFVDVDDTLILWSWAKTFPEKIEEVKAWVQRRREEADGVYYNEPFKINQRSVRGIRNYRLANRDALIVVWSGGGKEYVAMFVDRLGLTDIVEPMGKSGDTIQLALEEEASIVVDDMESFRQSLAWRAQTFGPFDWPEGESDEFRT